MSTAVILALVSPMVAVAVAAFGFRRSTRADQLRAFFEMQDRYLSERVREGRRIIHNSIAGGTPDHFDKLNHQDRSTVGYSLAILNAIAIACEGRYVNERLVIISMGRSYSNAVRAALPYLDHIETLRGYRPYAYAERLAGRIDTQ